ncbi:hypothetical protein L6R50_27875 [Myxococcota bacterium]|nr:hypothetical protein [Myxococcota bacterium]
MSRFERRRYGSPADPREGRASSAAPKAGGSAILPSWSALGMSAGARRRILREVPDDLRAFAEAMPWLAPALADGGARGGTRARPSERFPQLDGSWGGGGGSGTRPHEAVPGLDGAFFPPEEDGILPDEPRTGISFLRLKVMFDPSDDPRTPVDEGETFQDLLDFQSSHGAPAVLAEEMRVLGVGYVRLLEDCDAFLESVWKGGVTAWDGLSPSPESETNAWQPGWGCDPTRSAGSLLIQVLGEDVELPFPGDLGEPHRWTGGEGCGGGAPATPEPCTFPDDAPPLFTDALLALTAELGLGVAPVPLLIDKSNADPASQNNDAYFSWYPWLVHPHGPTEGIPHVDETDRFWIGSADTRDVVDPAHDVNADASAATYEHVDHANADRVLEEYVRRLASDPKIGSLWGDRIPYVDLGNELNGVVPEADIAWLVLRSCELWQGCAPGVRRVLPAAASFSNGHGASPSDPRSYLDEALDHYDRLFFEIVRAAFVLQEEEAAPDRFADVLGPAAIDGWTAFHAHYDLAAILLLLTGQADPSDAPLSRARDLKYDNPLHLRVLKEWCGSQGLSAPFHALDFHWYDSSGKAEGGAALTAFSYLSGLRPLVEDVFRVRLREWWGDGDDVGIWCTETGISSDQRPLHYVARREVDAVDGKEVYGHLAVKVSPGTIPPSSWADYEFRVDPVDLDAAALAAFGGSNAFSWPEWMFTSPREQAVQVWTRLCYMAGLGVEKVFWFANEAIPATSAGRMQGFYSYGLTDDTKVESVPAGPDGAILRPLEATPYEERGKKPAWCALRRWNQVLDRYRCARLFPSLTGDTPGYEGFYAVVFLRRAESAGPDDPYPPERYPYALVAWTDPQAYVWPTDWTGVDPAVAPVGAEHRLYFQSAAESAEVVQVRTLPEFFTRVPSRLENPCIESGDDLRQPGGISGESTYRYDDDLTHSTVFTRVPLSFPLQVDGAPLLLLLPEGEIRLDSPEKVIADVTLAGGSCPIRDAGGEPAEALPSRRQASVERRGRR